MGGQSCVSLKMLILYGPNTLDVLMDGIQCYHGQHQNQLAVKLFFKAGLLGEEFSK